MLKRFGYKVLEAPDGKVAMKLQHEKQADGVGGISLPEKKGIETLMGLRRKFPAVKIIAMSGSGCIASEN